MWTLEVILKRKNNWEKCPNMEFFLIRIFPFLKFKLNMDIYGVTISKT